MCKKLTIKTSVKLVPCRFERITLAMQQAYGMDCKTLGNALWDDSNREAKAFGLYGNVRPWLRG